MRCSHHLLLALWAGQHHPSKRASVAAYRGFNMEGQLLNTVN